MPKFAERLKSLRAEKCISQADLAKQIKLSKSSINMYERGEREPGLETLERIADFFNVDMDYLLGKSDIIRKIHLHDSVEYVRALCKERNIAISVLERECGFANGYLNPKKMSKLPYDRAIVIANYLGISASMILTGEDAENTPADLVEGNGGFILPSDKNVVRIAGRDGSYQERFLTDKQKLALEKFLDILPDVPDDL